MEAFELEEKLDDFFGLIIKEIGQAQLQAIDLEDWIDLEGYSYNVDGIREILIGRDGQSLHFHLFKDGQCKIMFYEFVNGKLSFEYDIVDERDLCENIIKHSIKEFFFGNWHKCVSLLKTTTDITDIVSQDIENYDDFGTGSEVYYL